MIITSTSNDQVKDVVSLQSRARSRRNDERFVIEGVNLIEEAIEADVPIERVFYTEDFTEEAQGVDIIDDLSRMGSILVPVSGDVMAHMSDTHSPQGILAVMPWLHLEVPEDFDYALVIDGISDPGNMGTIMRTAVGAGIKLMIVTTGTVDFTNPKVVRAAMGAHFRLPIQHLSWEGIANWLDRHAIFLADVTSGAAHHSIDWTQPSALIVSDETQGPSDEALRTAHAHITVPMPGRLESLNVSVATGVMLFEMVRQRIEAGMLDA